MAKNSTENSTNGKGPCRKCSKWQRTEQKMQQMAKDRTENAANGKGPSRKCSKWQRTEQEMQPVAKDRAENATNGRDKTVQKTQQMAGTSQYRKCNKWQGQVSTENATNGKGPSRKRNKWQKGPRLFSELHLLTHIDGSRGVLLVFINVDCTQGEHGCEAHPMHHVGHH